MSHAQGVKTGKFTMTSTPAQILGSGASSHGSIISESTPITWEVYVPENYDANKPSGIMVFAGSPQNVIAPMGWLSVMEDNNLIWVAPRKSQSAASIYQRELMAMLSVPLIDKDYNIDKNRVYITGEGRIAGMASMNYPETFKGAIYLGDKVWSDDAQSKIDNIKNNRFVFVTEENGNFAHGNRQAYTHYKNAGVENSKLVFIKEGLRYTRPKFAQSVEYLDNPGSTD
jgi:predicted peptidase